MPVKDAFKNIADLIFVKDEDDDYDEEEVAENSEKEDYQEVSNKDINMQKADMLLFDPRSFEESTTIARNLMREKVCIVNIRRLNEGSAQRLLDFLQGVIFALHGTVEQVDESVIVYAPKKTLIAGKINSEE